MHAVRGAVVSDLLLARNFFVRWNYRLTIGGGIMSTEPYTPTGAALIAAYISAKVEIITLPNIAEIEMEAQRGIAKIKADAFREAAVMVADRDGMGATITYKTLRARADRIEAGS